MNSSYWLTNIKLESGYQFENGNMIGTKTELHHLRIEDGKIAQILSADQPLLTELPLVDGKNMLLLPSFQEMHIHLDKTYYGGPWKCCMPVSNLFERHEEDKGLLPMFLSKSQERAELILELMLQNGITRVRDHCHVDPQVGLKFLEALQRAYEPFSGKISREIVAFPHYGLLRTNAKESVREALRQGATHVGGVDPAGVDGDVEKSLQTMMELAVENNADVDLHLHDPGHLTIFTIKRLAAMTEEAGWQGRVTISHALGLGDVSLSEVSEVAEMLAQLRIDVTSTVPINRLTIPIPLLHEKGVLVSLGNDGVMGNWSPFGSADILEKANRFAERFRWSDERSLSKALGFITGGKIPLNESGTRIWPVVGDEASGVLVDSSCSAETIARRTKPQVVIAKGNVMGTIAP
ncbi:amidohydrolase [Brevibacillus sp. SIMBA_040]|uniref:amidohydrolase n=2 Tax=Bacillales TaxID=1385 RepID=UPI00397E85DD